MISACDGCQKNVRASDNEFKLKWTLDIILLTEFTWTANPWTHLAGKSFGTRCIPCVCVFVCVHACAYIYVSVLLTRHIYCLQSDLPQGSLPVWSKADSCADLHVSYRARWQRGKGNLRSLQSADTHLWKHHGLVSETGCIHTLYICKRTVLLHKKELCWL